VASFHTIFEDKRIWIEALKNAIQNPDVDVIGHLVPESTFDLDDHELSELASINIKTYRKMFCMRYWNEVDIHMSTYENTVAKGETRKDENDSFIGDSF
jgi:histidinol phosphatase-like PHP family hydrolase